MKNGHELFMSNGDEGKTVVITCKACGFTLVQGLPINVGFLVYFNDAAERYHDDFAEDSP